MREPWERIGGILEGVVEQALEHEGIQSLHISYSATVTSGWAHLTAFYVDRKNKREGDAFRVSACVCVYIQAFSFKQSTTQLYTNYIGWRKTLLVVPLWLIWFLFFWLSSFVLTVVPKRKSVPNTPPFFSLRISLKSNLIYMQMSRLVECKWRLMDASHLAPNGRVKKVLENGHFLILISNSFSLKLNSSIEQKRSFVLKSVMIDDVEAWFLRLHN